MGVKNAWPFFSSHKLLARDQIPFTDFCASTNQRIYVDVMSVFFNKFKNAALKNNLNAFAGRLKQLFLDNLDQVWFVIDGHRSVEKWKTHFSREEKRKAILEKAARIIRSCKKRSKRCLKTGCRKRISKLLHQSFAYSFEDKIKLLDAMQSIGLNTILAPGEADVYLAKCPNVIAVTIDSDFLFIQSISVVLKAQVQGNDILVTPVLKDDLLEKLDLDRESLAILGVISGNDYSDNYKQYGLKRNYEIIR